jgi:uncharacterized alkaline shock family protein YloU
MTKYLIATSVLEAIVRGSLAGDRRLRVRSSLPLARTHPVEVNVTGDTCSVTVHLDALLGENMPALAEDSRRVIAAALTQMTGLSVAAVDVVFAGAFTPDA